MAESLLVSVVTPSYNQARFLPATLASVAEQDYPRIEHIVIDGGSTDGSLEILAEHPGVRSISEPDRGQSHAVNKGFELASGDVLCWLNSDDVFAPGAVRRVVEFFEERPEARFVFGDAVALDARGREWGRRINVAAGNLATLLEERDFIVQPAAFWRRELLDEVGPLREDLRYVMDYELWMRMAKRHPLHYLPEVLAGERIHGETKTAQGGLARIEELRQVVVAHGGAGVPRWFLPEAAAAYLRSGIAQVLRGRLRKAARSFGEGLGLGAPAPKTLAFLLTGPLLGGGTFAYARLWSNRLRSRRRASPELSD